MILILFSRVSTHHEAVHVVKDVVKMCFMDEHRYLVIKHYYLSGHSYARVRNVFFFEYDESISKMQIKWIVYRYKQHN